MADIPLVQRTVGNQANFFIAKNELKGGDMGKARFEVSKK